MRGDDLLRDDALLHPAFESFQEVVIGVDHRPVTRAITKGVGAVTATAMRHARHHKEPIEFLDFLPSVAVLRARFNACQLGPYAVVVVDTIDRSDCRVRPPDVVDDLGAMCPQWPEVGIGGVEDWPEVLIGERDIAREVQRPEVPIRVLKTKYPKNPLPKNSCSAWPVLFDKSASREALVIQAGQLEGFDSLPGS